MNVCVLCLDWNVYVKRTFYEEKLAKLFEVAEHGRRRQRRTEGRHRLLAEYLQLVRLVLLVVHDESEYVLELRASARRREVRLFAILQLLEHNRNYVVADVSLSFELFLFCFVLIYLFLFNSMFFFFCSAIEKEQNQGFILLADASLTRTAAAWTHGT